jgi:hypothetical protein
MATRKAELRNVAPEQRQVPVALCRHRAEHREHQAEMLDHNRSVLDASAEEGAQCDLDDRDQHHQHKRRG